MAIVQCANKHYYDNAKFKECPHCRKNGNGAAVAADTSENKTIAKPKSVQPVDQGFETRSLKNMIGKADDAGKTVGIYFKDKNMNPIAGWLVCIKGENKGRSFEIHIGKNFIGRSMKMDIHSNDEQVSRENHVSVIFEPKKCKFYLLQGNGMTYYNGELLANSAQLSEGDLIDIGQSSYVFVPYCKEGREWDD